MDNFELHQEAMQLADSHSPYMLARLLLMEEKDRIELAAHVERIISEWNEGDDQFSDEWINRMGDIIEDTPTPSLTRRDLIKQAEVLEYMGEEVENMHPKENKDGIAAHLTHVSRGYRQQANKPRS